MAEFVSARKNPPPSGRRGADRFVARDAHSPARGAPGRRSSDDAPLRLDRLDRRVLPPPRDERSLGPRPARVRRVVVLRPDRHLVGIVHERELQGGHPRPPPPRPRDRGREAVPAQRARRRRRHGVHALGEPRGVARGPRPRGRGRPRLQHAPVRVRPRPRPARVAAGGVRELRAGRGVEHAPGVQRRHPGVRPDGNGQDVHDGGGPARAPGAGEGPRRRSPSQAHPRRFRRDGAGAASSRAPSRTSSTPSPATPARRASISSAPRTCRSTTRSSPTCSSPSART